MRSPTDGVRHPHWPWARNRYQLPVSARRTIVSSSVEQGHALSAEQRGRMEMLGITHVPVDYFHVAGFRYTQLKDAIAQAERQLALK